jgi:hypothetical protein
MITDVASKLSTKQKALITGDAVIGWLDWP